MSSIFEKFKQKAIKPRSADEPMPLPVDPTKKVDAKRLAEMRAEVAGAAAREAAAARGESTGEIGGPLLRTATILLIAISTVASAACFSAFAICAVSTRLGWSHFSKASP